SGYTVCIDIEYYVKKNPDAGFAGSLDCKNFSFDLDSYSLKIAGIESATTRQAITNPTLNRREVAIFAIRQWGRIQDALTWVAEKKDSSGAFIYFPRMIDPIQDWECRGLWCYVHFDANQSIKHGPVFVIAQDSVSDCKTNVQTVDCLLEQTRKDD